MTPHDSIIISLPYPFKFLGLTIAIKRKIGFMFTNLTFLMFCENNNLKTSEDFKKLQKEKGQPFVLAESMFAAYVAYSMVTKQKQKYSKEGLIKAISLTDDQARERLVKAWEASYTFGGSFKKKAASKQ